MDAKNIVSICGGLGAVITLGVQVERYLRERSASNRRRQYLTRVEELVRFVELAPRIEKAGSNRALQGSAVDKAKKELDCVLAELDRLFGQAPITIRRISEVSYLRRWFLLFAPGGGRALLAHFLFYSLFSLVVFFVLSLAYDEAHDEFMWDAFRRELLQPIKWLVFLGLLCPTLALRYWAIVEHDWSARAPQAPTRRAQLLLWYRPVNGNELLARLLLWFSGYYLLLSLVTHLFDIQWLPSDVGYPTWYAVVNRIFLPWSFVLAYFWSRAECRASRSGSAPPPFPHNLRFLYAPSNIQELGAQLSFYGFAAFTVVNLFGPTLPAGLLGMVPGEEEEALFTGAAIGWLLTLCTSALLPLYGSHLWGLAAYRTSAAKEGQEVG